MKSLVSGGRSTGHGYRSQLHMGGAEAVGQEGTGLACATYFTSGNDVSDDLGSREGVLLIARAWG